MTCIEFIKVQTENKPESFLADLVPVLDNVAEGLCQNLTSIYCNVGSNREFAILICTEKEPGNSNHTSEGEIINDYLRRIGLVDHSIWQQIDSIKSTQGARK